MAQEIGGLRLPKNAVVPVTLPNSIVELNKNLADWYGTEITGRAIFRIVWANNETEIVHGVWTDLDNEGNFIRQVTETRQIRKYSDDPDYAGKFILERLVLVPPMDERTLPTVKMSYEPLWTFENVLDKPVPPTVDGTRFIIDLVLSREGKVNMKKKYVTQEEELQLKSDRIRRIQDELYGGESDIADALHFHSGIVVPSQIKEN